MYTGMSSNERTTSRMRTVFYLLVVMEEATKLTICIRPFLKKVKLSTKHLYERLRELS